MRGVFLVLTLVLTSVSLAQTKPQWVRYPSISPDGAAIVFTYKGNLFRVAATGGTATQLTFHNAHDYKAVWSRDGQRIAFASDRYGNFDIFSMDALGGAATRLTFHSTDEIPYAYSHDNRTVLFGATRQDAVKHRQYPTGSQPELYAVAPMAGSVNQVLTVPAQDVQTSKDGGFLLYHDKKGYEDEFRKHHVSAITRDVWKYDTASGKHTMLTSFKGEDRNPVLSTDEKTVYYLSEESGNFNVHKFALDTPSQNQQLTNLKTHPVRFLSYGNGVMAFSYDGELYTLKDGGQPEKVPVLIRTQDGANTDKFVSINAGVREMAISPNGKEIAFIARGEVFVTAIEGGLTKRLTNTPEQERFVRFTHDGKGVAYASEREGRWQIYKTTIVRKEEPYFFAATLLKEETVLSKDVDTYLPEFSPDGKQLAYIEDRRTLKVLNLDTKTEKTLLTPDELYHMRDGDKYFKWSPDSKWLVVSWGKTLSNGEILLVDAEGNKKMNLTQSGYYDYYPKWVNEGKQLLWFSNRDGLKSYATSGSTQNDVYTMFLNQESWDKFNLSKEDFDLMKLMDEKKDAKKEDEASKDKKKKDKKKKDEDKETVKPLIFDVEAVDERKARLTIHSSNLGDAVLSKDGEKLYYLARFEKNMNLWETELRTKKTKMLISLGARSGSLQWDKDQEDLFLLSDGSISKVDLAKAAKEPVKMKSEMQLDTDAERQHMFEHIWLRTNAIFYHSNFHGQDWEMLKKEYEKYIPHLGNSYEFAEMVSELLGELNVSHAGGRFGTTIPNADATASLGIFIDYSHKDDGLKIAEIIKGGPLDKAALNIKAGSIIEKINGEPILANTDPAKYLNRLAGTFTLLEVRDPKTQKRQQLRVKPISLSDENRLLYKRWVKQNEKEVAEKSKGKLGYVHIPGMSDGPYRTIYEQMLGKFADKEAVIVDTRFNGGGDLVADLAMFFTGEPFITYETEDRQVGGEPTSRWTKPTLAIFNESMYSDGHCFASGYTDLKIGKTVGMPVPGTCSFAGWERLPNGGVWGVVPVSAKNKAGEWMENNQTEPMIQVKNEPDVINTGIDQQLERSIMELMKEVN
ncbi:Putative peptidase/protease family protein [Croceitalea dokdonensis DOKDO 023]|uniref:Tricorn protease homolog n=1 Tax=Croceitalea dokdonensis DOKDO 023 TaxID=1300341 RepID=A0A0P7AY49_9FLAO|nr:S41 family peptidase [Croceitalea dokdonensis]KPM33144.1 Putative peptidase/protease family protein [Croceitalea dokdonensis DOKDO 023]